MKLSSLDDTFTRNSLLCIILDYINANHTMITPEMRDTLESVYKEIQENNPLIEDIPHI